MWNKIVDAIKSGTDSFKELAIIYLISSLIASILFAIFEGRNIWDSTWWAYITGLGIGYGDIYPHTGAGEVLTLIWAHFMQLFLYPLFIARVLLNAFQPMIERIVRNIIDGKTK